MGENTINKFNYPWPISNGRTWDYYSCHLWSMNMKRSNYLCVMLCMDSQCKYIHSDELLCTVKARKGVSLQTPPIVSSAAINSSPRAGFTHQYWWRRRQRQLCGLLWQPHKRWRQMDTHLIKSTLDYMKIEGANWWWMCTMGDNQEPCLNFRINNKMRKLWVSNRGNEWAASREVINIIGSNMLYDQSAFIFCCFLLLMWAHSNNYQCDKPVNLP